jgi:hypothetical protein
MIQKIREATTLLVRNLALFGSIILTVWLPASILLVYLRLHVFPATGGDELQIALQEVRVNNVIELAFGPLCTGAIIYAAAQLKQGAQVTYREAMSYGAKQSLRLLGTRIPCGFIVVLGLLAFIIPGIVLALRFALIDSIVILERINGLNARKRSVELTRGRRWQILGTVTLTLVWTAILVAIPSFLFELAGQSNNFGCMVIDQSLSNIVLILLDLVLFLLYWEAQQNQSEQPPVE